MIKYMLALLLCASSCFAGIGIGVTPYPGPGTVVVSGGGGCSATPFTDDSTRTSSYNPGSAATEYYAGTVNTSATTKDVCSVEFYINKQGSVDGKTIYIEHWAINSSTAALETKKATLATLSGNIITTTFTWYKFDFSSISMVQNDAIVVTLNETINTSNYIRVGYNGTGTLGDFRGRYWNSSGAAASTGAGVDITSKLYGL